MNETTQSPLPAASAHTPGVSYMASGHSVFSNERVRSVCEAGSDADATKIASALNACASLPNPAQDVAALVAALKAARHVVAECDPETVREYLPMIDKALAQAQQGR